MGPKPRGDKASKEHMTEKTEKNLTQVQLKVAKG